MFKQILSLTSLRRTLCALALLSGSVFAAPADRNEVQLLAKPKAAMSEVALRALLSAHGGRQHGTVAAIDVRVIRVPQRAAAKLLEALRRHRDVEYAEPDFAAQAIATANDPYYAQDYQWHLARIQGPKAWDVSTGSTGVTIAIVDSGVTASHPDLAGKILPGYDFVSNDNDPSDDNGHGTSVAGTAAAATNNSLGVASVAWHSPVLPVKVLGASGSGSYSAIANGITYSADKGARIINLSLGGTSSSRTLQDAVNYAWNKGAVLIAAAGNNGNDVLVYPAACTNVVAVSATNFNDLRTSWSNFGSYVDIAAPGEDIVTVGSANGYVSTNGTSFSSPVVAGVVALMASAYPSISKQQLVDLLLKNSDDIGSAGYDVYYGHGRVNAYRAVLAAEALVTRDTTAPVGEFLSPSDGATLSGTVTVSVSATDNVEVTGIELYANGLLLARSSSASMVFSWNTLNVSDGEYTLELRAFDAAGNVGRTSLNVSVKNSATADAIAPEVAITSPGDGSKLTGATTKISVVSTDNVAVTKVELYIDGKLSGSGTSASVTFSWNTRKVAAGSHTLQACAYDAAGNVADSSIVTVWK